jgi:pantetheine-phosphate adenylyltransferase
MTETVPMRGVYAGSFDPPMRGHINIIQRAARLCDELLIGVGDNISKTYIFSKEERVRLVSAATESLSNTEVLAFDGLLADFCVENNVDIIFRGTRNAADARYEQEMAQAIYHLSRIPVMFLCAEPDLISTSSSVVGTLLALGDQDISAYVPPSLAQAIPGSRAIQRGTGKQLRKRAMNG